MTLKILPHIQDPALPVLLDIINTKSLNPVYQPILDYRTHTYLGYEGLIRGPLDSILYSPAALFACAERNDLTAELEYVCMPTILNEFSKQFGTGKLFINITPLCLQHPDMIRGAFLDMIRDANLSPRRIVIELTESHRVSDFASMRSTLMFYRNFGCQLALDDFGEGFSNLRVWSEIRPDFIKLDRHFIDCISIDPLKYHFVKAILELAGTCKSRVIAEGMEREDDFLTVRDLNIECGQGFFIAKPLSQPPKLPSTDIKKILATKKLKVFPTGMLYSTGPLAKQLMLNVLPVALKTTSAELRKLFENDKSLDAIPVINEDHFPVGVITQNMLLDSLLTNNGTDECRDLITYEPLVVDHNTTVQELSVIMSNADRRCLHEGFLVIKDGKYAGLLSGHDLITTITDMQIQSAIYANTLTGLPGNVPVEQHIDRLINANTSLVVCRIDLSNFKTFNDTFGYKKGDDLIKLVSNLLLDVIDKGSDFVGHLGGDDFIIIFQSYDWAARCSIIIEAFETRTLEFFPISSILENGYTAENRKGEPIQYSWPTLSIGIVKVDANTFNSHYEILAAANIANTQAKREKDNIFVDRRKRSSTK